MDKKISQDFVEESKSYYFKMFLLMKLAGTENIYIKVVVLISHLQ